MNFSVVLESLSFAVTDQHLTQQVSEVLQLVLVDGLSVCIGVF